MTHTFVVPAFGEPQWLERCVDSLERQTLPSRIVIATSTPNQLVTSIAERRRIPLMVNGTSQGIAADWNFALTQADSDWVSLAHQDDWYAPDYVEACLSAAGKVATAILVFTDAVETLEGEPALVVNARVKRALRAAAFLTSDSIESRFRRKLLLAFGNPIPCPAVMLNRRLLGSFSFEAGWRSNLDWRAWITLAKRPGAFVYVARPLVHRTLHRHAATTRELEARAREDDRMFREIWPAPIAAALSRIYSVSRRPYSALRTAHDR